MKKILSMGLVMMMLLAIAAGCSDTQQPDPDNTGTPENNGEVTPDADAQPESAVKEITYGRPYDATTMDVHNANDDGSYEILQLIGEGLVRNKGGVIVPGIAESWDVSDDGTEYTFHLRESTWSDGTPLTAKDFEYTYLRIIDPTTAFKNAEQAYALFDNAREYHLGTITDPAEVGVKAVDDKTLVITTPQPNIETLYTLARYPWYPVRQDYAEQHGMAYGAEADTIMTNGPFKLTEWLHEDRLVLEKNENYWDADIIKLTKITGIVGATAETGVDMMLSGTLDIMATTDYNQMASLQDAGMTVESYTSQYQFVYINASGKTDESGKFLTNANFRLALNYSINRKAIAEGVFTGSEPAYRITAPGTMGVNGLFQDEYPFEGYPVEGDPEKAKEYFDLAMQELGTTVDDIPELSMLCFDSQRSLTVLQAVQDMLLSTLGVKCYIDPQPIQQMLAKVSDGDYDLWWGGQSLGSVDWASPDSFLGNYDFRMPSYTGTWRNEEFIQLYDIVRQTMDMKERKDALFEIEKILCLQDPPFILVAWTQNYVVHVPELSGLLLGNAYDMTYMDLNR